MFFSMAVEGVFYAIFISEHNKNRMNTGLFSVRAVSIYGAGKRKPNRLHHAPKEACYLHFFIVVLLFVLHFSKSAVKAIHYFFIVTLLLIRHHVLIYAI